MPETRGKSVATAVLLLTTVIWGIGYAIEGGYLLLVWADFLPGQPNDLSGHIIAHFDRPIALIALFGVLFLVVGFVALFAALGLHWQRQWGRFLLFLIAVLAVCFGSSSLEVGPSIPDTMNVPLGVAQLLYGFLALALLSLSRPEPRGISILRLACFLVGLPAALYCLESVTAIVGFFHTDGGARRDRADFFFALSQLSEFVFGMLLVASGTCLFISHWKHRFVTVLALMIAAAGAQAALALFALLGALLGHTREGLLEGYLLIFGLPISIVLLVLTMSGLWYLKRPHIRRSFEAERER